MFSCGRILEEDHRDPKGILPLVGVVRGQGGKTSDTGNGGYGCSDGREERGFLRTQQTSGVTRLQRPTHVGPLFRRERSGGRRGGDGGQWS